MKLISAARRPFEVEAVQITDENWQEVALWSASYGAAAQEGVSPYYINVVINKERGRFVKAYRGDWVTCYQGKFRVYSDRNFQKAFQVFDDNSNQFAYETEFQGRVGLPTPADEMAPHNPVAFGVEVPEIHPPVLGGVKTPSPEPIFESVRNDGYGFRKD